MLTRHFTGIASACAVMLIVSACGAAGQVGDDAESYPRKPVHVVVPYAAGGPTDLAGRASSRCLSDELGKPFVVENKPGGAGAIGINEMVAGKPDGYTLAIATIGNMVVAPYVAEGVRYRSNDITPIGKIYEIPSVLVVGDHAPYRDAREFLRAAKDAPKTIRVATPGASTLYHVELRRLAKLYGIEVRLIPFNGTSEAMTALLGGNADAAFVDASQNIVEQIDSGQLRALATGADQQVSYLDGVPTLSELGFPELTHTTSFFALSAPAETPQPIVGKLTASLRQCLSDPEVKKRLGEDYLPTEFVGSESIKSEFAAADEIFREALGPGK